MHDIKNTLASFSQNIIHWSANFPQQIEDIISLEKTFLEKENRLSDNNLRLSIGIMGQVKAGKSSFLNALLFQGKPILPEAATPKTANLTRISYGDKPLLLVEYYLPEEWDTICKAAATTSESAEARVGRDLVKMAQQHQLDVPTLLAKGTESIEATSTDELMTRMNSYVGEDGRYTAVVKSTEIQLPLEELKGFEVVDTPGMNDPVPSRTQKTHEYMRQCDVVFFLSRCSQFLDQADIDLLSRQLPGNGVKRMVLVACQLDGVLLDDGHDRASLAETERNVKTRISRRANTEIEKLAAFREQLGPQHQCATDLLRSIKTPIFSSTYAHMLSHQPPEQWSKSLRHTHEELNNLAKANWNHYQFSTADWLRIGNFPELEAAYHAARNDKKSLLQAQRDQLIPGTCTELGLRLKRLNTAVEARANQLHNGDLKRIEANVLATEKQMDAIHARLAKIVDQLIVEAKSAATKMQSDLRKHATAATKIQTRTGSSVVEESYTVSTSSWYKPWTWGDTRRVYYTTTTSYKYLAVSDAIENVVNYANKITADLQQEFNKLVSVNSLRTNLKQNLLEVMNVRSENFNPADFKAIFEGTLDRINIPKLQFSLGDVGKNISHRFSGEVQNDSAMEALRTTLNETVDALFKQLIATFIKAVDTLCQELATVRDSLGHQLADDLRKELEQLRKAFASKEQELQAYQQILTLSQSTLKAIA